MRAIPTCVAVAVALTACAVSAPPAKPNADLVNTTKLAVMEAQKAYTNCAYNAASKYARKPDFQPQDIATTVVIDCRPQATDDVEAFRRYTVAQHPDWSEQRVERSASSYARGREDQAREYIVAFVLRLRAGN